MKDLTTQEKALLLGKIKSFLSITWNDPDTDKEIWDMIVSSIIRIDDIAGAELDYLLSTESTSETYNTMCYLGQDLLKNRVFYIREKGLDDFEKNYKGEITSLFLKGKVYKNANQ